MISPDTFHGLWISAERRQISETALFSAHYLSDFNPLYTLILDNQHKQCRSCIYWHLRIRKVWFMVLSLVVCTFVGKTWTFSMFHRCVPAQFLIKHKNFRKHASNVFRKHACNMQISLTERRFEPTHGDLITYAVLRLNHFINLC